VGEILFSLADEVSMANLRKTKRGFTRSSIAAVVFVAALLSANSGAFAQDAPSPAPTLSLRSDADDQINALKADVRLYRDRANRAEKWLQQISSEIEHKFLGADDSSVRRAPPQNENNNPARFSFLRRQQDH
jgi:hypothetical protein